MWWLLLFLPVCGVAPNPDTFTVSGPDGPLSVWMGSSIILPCSVSPAFTESLKVRWHRPEKYKTPVLLYEKQQIQQQSVDPQFRGRVSLVGELEKGKVSLKLDNVSPADRGEFICFVSGDKWYEQASVHLIVKAMGSPPVLSVTDGGSGQVNVTCVSDGWSPQPTLTWRNNRGTEIPSQSHHSATDAYGLVSVTSWLLHSSSDSEWVACSVGLSDEERRESRILPHTSRTNTVELERILRDREIEMETLKQKSEGPWKDVLIIVLVLLLLSSIAAAFILYKKGFIIRKDSKEAAAEYQQLELLASGGETENLLKKKEVETLKQEEEGREKRVGTLKKEEETLKQKIAELKSQLDTSKGKVETQNQPSKDLLKKHSEEMETLEKEVETLQKNNTELQSQLDTSKSEVETLNQQIKDLLKKHSEEVETLKEKITDAFPQNQGLIMLWRTVNRENFKEDLTMDEDSVQGDLEVHPRGKIVKCTKLNRDEPLDTMSTYVLCKKTFSSGQHSWEVNVKAKKSWFVGVCSDTLRGQNDVYLTPQNGCWLLCYDVEPGLYVNTDTKITSVQKKMKYLLERIGVFLDCCRHSLTFYDVQSESCLCTICDVGPSLQLVPVFSPGGRDQYDLTICNQQVNK